MTIWHPPTEEMHGTEEIVAIHSGTLSIGYAFQLIHLLDQRNLTTWCYTKDLVQVATLAVQDPRIP